MPTSQEINNIKKIKGKARGVVLVTDFKYIKGHKGEDKAQEVNAKIQEVDPAFDYNKIDNTNWYPARWRMLSLLMIREKFKWKEKEMHEMGRAAPYNSFIAKMVLRYFFSFKKTCQEAEKYWNKHYSYGNLELVKFDNKEKVVVYRLKNFNPPHVFCGYLKGYIQGVAELSSGSSGIKIRETQCPHRGGKYQYHEFTLSGWK